MIGSPDNESPVGPVPQSTHQEDDERVPYDLCLRATAAAERNVYIIAEPGRQGNVPTSPEFSDISAEIWHIEVPHQLDTKQLGCADGNIRIAGEVSVDLEGEEDGGKQQRTAAVRLVGGKDLVHIDGAVIGHDHFFEQAPENLPHSICSLFVHKRPRFPELRQQVCRPFNRAGHELREETDEGEELDDIARGLQLSAVYVDRITQCLESIETNAHGKDYLNQQSGRIPAQERISKGGDEKVVILENSKNQQVNYDVNDIHRLGLAGIVPTLFNQQTRPETARGRECNQEQESPIPPSVEDVGHHHDEEILQLEVLTEDEPIEQKHYRQEDGEFYGVEKHLSKGFRCDTPPPAGKCCGNLG